MWGRIAGCATLVVVAALSAWGCEEGEPGTPGDPAPGRPEPPEPEPEPEPAGGASSEAALELDPPSGPRVVLGALHGCVVDPRGRVGCWGSNRFGQLGTPDPTPGPEAEREVAAPVEGLDGVVSLAAGAFHTCALRRDGTVRCWGHGGHGLSGDGQRGGADVLETTPVSGVRRAVQLAAGEGFTCARLRDGTVSCWGRNDHGQLGRGERGAVGAPGLVGGLDDAVAIAAGRHHACARTAAGAVACWGQAVDGQVGSPLRGAVPSPSPVDVDGEAMEVAAGGYHTCARLSDGTVRCFGANDSGQLGTGDGGAPASRRAEPRAVKGIADAAELALGERFSCVRHRDGTVSCFGYNAEGQLGDGTTRLRKTPVRVKGLNDAVHVAAGGQRACAVREGRPTPHCW